MEPAPTPPDKMSPSPRRRWLGVAARVLIIGTIFYFIFAALARNWGELRQHEFSLSWQPIALSYLVFCVYLMNRALIWHWMTHKFACAIPLRQAVAAWFYSLLGKYVPGKVFLLAGRLHFYRREGRSALSVSMCFGLETIGILLASILVLLVAPLFVDLPLVAHYRWPAILLAALLLVAIRPRHLELLANPLLKLARRPPISLPLQYRDALVTIGLFSANWVLLGLGFVLLVNAIYPVDLRYLVYLAGSFALANMIGLLAIFAPAGIGVREGIMVLALGVLMPKALAVVVALGTRVWMTVGELLAAGAVALLLSCTGQSPRRRLGSSSSGDKEGAAATRRGRHAGEAAPDSVEGRDSDLFDDIAPKYVRLHGTPSSRAALRYLRLRALRPLLHKGSRVGVLLDAGCGIAPTVDYLDGWYDRYIGVDHSKSHIDVAARAFGHRKDVHLLTANIKNVPLPDRTADVVLAVEALHHMTDLPSVMRSLRRLAKPAAHFIAMEPQRGNLVVQALRAVRKRVDRAYSSDQVAFSGEQLEALLADAGLHSIDSEYVGLISPVFAQIAPRPQFLFRALSAAAIAIDECSEPLMRRAGRWLGWYIVLRARFPGHCAPHTRPQPGEEGRP